MADYKKLISDQKLCEKRNSGEIDEVWVWGGGWLGFYESNLAGTGAFYMNSGPTTGTACTKILPIMGLNPEVGLDNALHSFGHRFEFTMVQVYRSSWGTWLYNTPRNNYEKFAVSKSNNLLSGPYGCGETEIPFNVGGGERYNYSSETAAQSYCDAFLNYPNLDTTNAKSVNCQEWGCSQYGYQKWWMTRVPYFSGTAPDGKLNNWWNYFINPEKAL